MYLYRPKTGYGIDGDSTRYEILFKENNDSS